MRDLEIFELYNISPDMKKDSFGERLNSKLNVKTDYDKIVCDFEWIDVMDETIRYIDNILRNPNRFIINEEEIVKIELARRITVESIKHLSRNTNLIQDYDKKTGDVRPSKILNVNKDESYNTYENRFIYTLIQNMKTFISMKKRDMITSSSLKDLKKFEYQAATTLGSERININLSMESKIMNKMEDGTKDGMNVAERIERLEMKINDLSNSEVYRMLQKLHVALVRPPIKKTNLILKNTNFQYAMNLWNYMQEHMNDNTKREKEAKDYEDEDKLKRYMDDAFLLDYLTMNTLSKEAAPAQLNEETIEKLTDSLIDKIVSINADLPEEKLQEMIGSKILISRQNNVASLRQVQNAFSRSIDNFLDKIKEFDFEGVD